MNWVLTIRRLLGRFWYDIFADNEFLLGIEYLLSSYSKLTENQYLNWVNGLIAKDTSVEQDEQPFIVYIAVDGPTIGDVTYNREWYSWEKMWDDGSAKSLINNTTDGSTGWVRYCKDPVPVPFYMTDHTIDYQKVLIQGMDYDVYENKFLFYTDPTELNLDVVKITDKDGMPKAYYRLFGYQKKTVKVCDPVTGFESSWLNDYSDIVWDIHQNGVTHYNMKQLLGKVTDSVICEKAGAVQYVWDEQGYHCMMVADKVYCSKKDIPATQITYIPEPTQEEPEPEPITVSVPMYGVQADVDDHKAASSVADMGSVLFGSLQVYKGTDEVTATDVPGLRVQTDAGELVAINQDDMAADYVAGMCALPLDGPPDVLAKYKQICAANMMNAKCPNIQVPPVVNPYKFVTQVLRRGRSVTVRLVAHGLDRLAAALNTIRKSCCASGMVNIYVAAESDELDIQKYVVQLEAVTDEEPTPTKKGQQYYNTDTALIYTAILDGSTLVWDTYGKEPAVDAVYKDASTDKYYECYDGVLLETSAAHASIVKLSCMSADAGMMAVAVVETMKIKEECAEAEVIL